MGSVTVGQEQFYRLSFRPDIPIGRWGVALDIELFIEAEGDISARGWEFGSATETFDSFLRKIYYLRYGRPDDAVYFKIGALDQVTLGYGLIMADYRNTLQYPGIKKTGVQFRFDNLADTGIGIEGVLNNFQDFQEGGALLGVRAFARPGGKLELGLTYVTDLDQYSGLRDGDADGVPDEVDAFPDNADRALDNDGDGVPDELDSDDDNDGIIDVDNGSGYNPDIEKALFGLNADFGDDFPVDQSVNRRKPFNKNQVGRDAFSIGGLDISYPLAQGKVLNLKLYGQFAMLIDDDDALSNFDAQQEGVFPGNRKAEGFGIAAPGLWLDMGPLNGQLEFRHFQDDFDARYFDELYEIDRARLDAASGRARPKDAQLQRGDNLNGVFGRIGASLGQYLYTSGSYQYLTGQNDPKQQLIGSVALSKKLLEQIPRLTRARAYYHKNNIGTRLNKAGTGSDGFFESTEDTFYGYDLGLEMAGGAAVLWDTRIIFDRGADQRLVRRKIMSIETVFHF
ncbi:MAG TPA: hypothetical protein EYG11_05520 [Candidatus Latescibacteria bacterium]|nr:hypothetical protein [Candidatus Handelsmanbacteria bacterium]HIL08140.1 hypothetical protein [Candidatus Latescibacterota bacterium]